MKTGFAVRAFLLMLAVAAPTFAADITWVSSTGEEPWKVQAAPQLVQDASAVADVVVHTRQVRQEIEGFGGCFNELGWKVLLTLPEKERGEILRDLFADEGCGFTLARMPIGASDYAREWYSLDETPGDYSLAQLSIERDKGYLLHYVKAAMAIRPELGVWLSAWSPPAWMKDNGRYNSGHLKSDAATQASYALYLAKAVQAYQAEGVRVYAAMVQNEPKSDSKYPTCVWTGEQEREFVRDYMGPVFREQRVKAEIWLGTINDKDPAHFAIPVLSDPAAAAFISGVAYQWEGREAIAKTHELFPNVKLMQSESECGNGKDSVADAEHTFGLLRTYFNGGANSYFYWNMVLPPEGVSTWGWKQNALITVDAETHTIAHHPEFYLMKHASHFVRPGSHLAEVTGKWGDKLAFVGADGSAILLIGNSANRPLPVVIGTDRTAGVIHAILPSHSFSTFVIPRV